MNIENKNYLIISKSTSQMLLVEKLLKEDKITTDLVPTPPETGTVCAIAIKIGESDLIKAKNILIENKIDITDILEDKKLKLQGFLNNKLGNTVSTEFIGILKKIENGDDLNLEEITYLLDTKNKKETDMIFVIADRIRKEMTGDIVEIRGAIEFSNYCTKSCNYCGINAQNNCAERYRMDEEEIMQIVWEIYNYGMKTVILQSGEDPLWDTQRVANLVKRIKTETNMMITLSVGEKTKEEYKILKDAGANNYLLKIESINRDIFKEIHPDDDYDYRLACSKWLKELGYLNGSGNIIGLPGQTTRDIAKDIIYFKEMGINMIGIGPFIPAKGSKYENLPAGDVELTLRTVALTRIVCKKVFIPSTTALASLDKDAQVWALNAGANTIMLINTPIKYRQKYKIYDNKNMIDMDAAVYAVKKAGRLLPKYLKLPTELVNKYED